MSLAKRVLVLRAENTKSRKQRAIPLTEGLAGQLRSLRVLHEQILHRLPNVGDRIFLSPEGCPWLKYTTNAMRIFDRLLKSAGIAKVRVDGKKLDIHALRHTCATRLTQTGAGLHHVQCILGHADPKLTASVYSHLEVEDLRGAVEGADAATLAASNKHTGSRRAR